MRELLASTISQRNPLGLRHYAADMYSTRNYCSELRGMGILDALFALRTVDHTNVGHKLQIPCPPCFLNASRSVLRKLHNDQVKCIHLVQCTNDTEGVQTRSGVSSSQTGSMYYKK